MKDNKHIHSFNEHQENLNISDVSNQLSFSELDDYISQKYDEYKEDFQQLWDEKDNYYNFENWWSDFLKYKYEQAVSKRKR